jgi:poly-beta-1,6-N-acetyl-D-glucosamine synthase
MLGWETRSFPDLLLSQLKPTGMGDGVWANWVKNGMANYISGYAPLFMFCKCLRRLTQRPYLVASLGLFVGFMTGYLKRVPQVNDLALIHYLRKQQIRRLLARESIWQ